MPAKKGSGNFIKDAMTEQFLESGIDKIYKLGITTTEQFQKTTGTVRDLQEQEDLIENRLVKMEVSLGHESIMKILKLLNPKRVNWVMGEPPTEEAKQKYGLKARWKWSDYDMKQLRLVAKEQENKA